MFNSICTNANRQGLFYVQCSEICGILYNSMFIIIQSVSVEKYVLRLSSQYSLDFIC